MLIICHRICHGNDYIFLNVLNSERNFDLSGIKFFEQPAILCNLSFLNTMLGNELLIHLKMAPREP